jgi:hypothetical protein
VRDGDGELRHEHRSAAERSDRRAPFADAAFEETVLRTFPVLRPRPVPSEEAQRQAREERRRERAWLPTGENQYVYTRKWLSRVARRRRLAKWAGADHARRCFACDYWGIIPSRRIL